MAHKSEYTGKQIDSAIQTVIENATAWSAKQDSITGKQGQIVGFNNDGTPEAQDASGVSSFNGRSGEVAPQNGDYTADMVGALSADTKIPTKVSELENDNKFVTEAEVDEKLDTFDSLLDGGTVGQVLTKTEDGAEWADAPDVSEQIAAHNANSNAHEDKASREDLQDTVEDLSGKITEAQTLDLPVTASSPNGTIYVATVSGISTLTAGQSFIMVPNITSASTTPTLNVNGKGSKTLKMRGGDYTSATITPSNTTWLAANQPVRVTYDGTFWVCDLYPAAESDITYGTADLTAGSSPLATGKLYICYE